ncbi:hypothetical protein, conserved [Eimeria maxima]|uniref:Uncharacterized protein n=1 Tax=Eimeria maxima TaxID=5804 RepID=U6M9R7_EIMMA|nr:hypothetical protein, conserved [Eimeria maxima]CDJ59788.1 hypothetical protein, conserved [Eimeria maxima]
MGLCSKTKARSPSHRSKPVELEPTGAAAASAAAVAKEPLPEGDLHAAAPECPGDKQTIEGEEGAYPLRTTPSSATAAEADSAAERPPSRKEIDAGIHGIAPPARNDSAATSCAGMTDAGGLSRAATLQAAAEKEAKKEAEDAKEKQPAEGAEKERKEQQEAPKEKQQQEEQQNVDKKEIKEEAAGEAKPQEDNQATQTPPQEAASTAAAKEEEKGNIEKEEEKREEEQGVASAAQEFTLTMQQTFTSFKESLSRSYRSLRSQALDTREEAADSNQNSNRDSNSSSSNNNNNNGSSSSSNSNGSSHIPPIPLPQQCMCGVLNEITDFGEKAIPCVLGEHADSDTELVGVGLVPPLEITMIVNTPGGAYLRTIPAELIQDAIDMGFITEEEVQKQKRDWEEKWGHLAIQYSPATSFARQDVKV